MALQILTERGWGVETGVFARMFSERLFPSASPEQVRWLTKLQRVSASVENASRLRRAFSDINVEALLPEVRVPALVLHSRREQAVPFEEGRRLAAGIAGARLVSLDSDNHLVLEDEPAWRQLRSEVRRFIGCAG